MTTNEKFLKMLGLSAKAGKALSGEDRVRESIRNKSAKLVILSKDASQNTKKRFWDNCIFYSVPLYEGNDRFLLGKAIGKDFAVVVSITSDDFKKAITDILDDLTEDFVKVF